MITVLWTIPNSPVAIQWRPGDALVIDSTYVRGDPLYDYLVPGETWTAQWPSASEAAGRPFKDLCAIFAMETNVLPTHYAVTWIDDERGKAVSRDRRHDLWRVHDITWVDGHLCVAREGTPLPAVQCGDAEDPGDIALGILGR